MIERPDECVKYWMTEDEFEQKKKIVEKYELTEQDVKYMIAYKFKS